MLRSLLTVASLALALAAPGLASAANRVPASRPTYLALGDSVPFGDDPTIRGAAKNDHWFVGYPTFLAEAIDLPLTSAACPGETSGSFLAAGAPDNGCREFRESLGLHVDYAGTQAAFAIEFLAGHPRTRFVTFSIGANDFLAVLHACAGEVACVAPQAPALLQGIVTNVATVLGAIRGAGYAGPILVPYYYAPNAQMDPIVQALNAGLQHAVDVTPFGARTVDVYSAFQSASGGDPCAAGLLIPLAEGCDIHPTEAGHRLIAETLAAALP
jgi:hypothetical protein